MDQKQSVDEHSKEIQELFQALGPAYNEHVIRVFAILARRHMLDCWPVNCCIQATRATILTLARFGISAVPFPCMMCVENPTGKAAKMVGFSEEVRRAINDKHNPERVIDYHVPREGWQGHLVAIADDRWLIDASFDQAAEPAYGLPIPEHILVVPVPSTVASGKQSIDLTGTIEDRPELRVRYWPTRDMTFMEQPGWRNRENYNVALGIVAEMRHKMGMPE